MDDDNKKGSNSVIYSAEKATELADLQKELEDKESRIEELKKQRVQIKKQLGNKRDEISVEKMETFKMLTMKYNCLWDEYYNNPLSATISEGKKQ